MDGITLRPPAALEPPMALALAANFGSVERWAESVGALARAHREDGGAIRLGFDSRRGTLANRWVACDAPESHDAEFVDLLAISLPIAAPDALAGLDWPGAYQRYQAAVHAASEGHGTHEIGDALVLDVRRAGVFAAAQTMLPGAAWHDPAALPCWAGHLPRDRRVLVYCVYGHEVGRVTALRLRSLGVDAHFLLGGIDAWQREGRATVAKHQRS